MKLEGEKFVIATVRDAVGSPRSRNRHRARARAAHGYEPHLHRAPRRPRPRRDAPWNRSRHARNLVKSDYAMLTTPNADGSALVMRVAEGDGLAGLEGSAVPIDASMAGEVIRDREPQLLVDSSSDPRMFRPPGWPADAGPALFVPMYAGNEILGSLTIVNRRGRDPSPSPTSRGFAHSQRMPRLRSRTPGTRRRSTESTRSTRTESAWRQRCTTP